LYRTATALSGQVALAAPDSAPEFYARQGAANTGTNVATDLLSNVNKLESTSIGV
jgi:hypothetical protein